MIVNIRECLERLVEVESLEEAEQRWKQGDFILTAEHFKGVEFDAYDDEVVIEQNIDHGRELTEQMLETTKKNIIRLLTIAIVNSDEHIKDTYGGEHALLNLIKGYFCLLEDLQAFKKREETENSEV